MTKKVTIISERIRLHENMTTSVKDIKIAEKIKKKGINSERCWKLIKNMKPKNEEARAQVKELGDILEDTEELKMDHSYQY